MNNAEVFKQYGTEQWAIEEALCFLLQSYWEEHCKERFGQSQMPYNPVGFVKQFMKEETLVSVEFAEKSKMATLEKSDIIEGEWREIPEEKPQNKEIQW